MSDERVESVENNESADIMIGSDAASEVDIGSLAGDASVADAGLASRDIENAITRKVISNVNLERVDTIVDCYSYLVDFSQGDITVVPSWLGSLKNFIVSQEYGVVNPDVAQKNVERSRTGQPELRADAALYFKTKGGISLVGYVDQLQMYKIIRDFLEVSFGKQIKVFVKDVGSDFNRWKASDVSGARLKL